MYFVPKALDVTEGISVGKASGTTLCDLGKATSAAILRLLC